jgi:Methyltransferase domain
MQWHASSGRDYQWLALHHLVSRYPAQHRYRRVLEFGGEYRHRRPLPRLRGITRQSSMWIAAFRFAQHRFTRRGLNARFVESRSPLPAPQGTYDVVVSFDVFEHLPDPLEAARRPSAVFAMAASSFRPAAPPTVAIHAIRGGGPSLRRPEGGIHLAGLGLRGEGSNVLVKVQGPVRWAQ